MNRVRELGALGQSVWLDYIRRNLMASGELARMIREDGLAGMTSNPAIFEKAIGGGDEYRSALAAAPGGDPTAAYEAVAIEDIRMATEAMLPVYRETAGRDGYVSLEVSPHLANDTAGTRAEARRLWETVARPNLMIKVPGTPEGVPAIEGLIAEGINVNVTLLFSRDAYAQAAEAYIRGLERRVERGEPCDRVASVASFFVSRIDTAVDRLLGARIEELRNDEQQGVARSLLGKTAIANAKLAYQDYRRIFDGPRWELLAGKGARPQRVLWASTSTKNPAYRDVLYLEDLIGPDTVTTIPPEAYEAFLDHGVAEPTLEAGVEEARLALDAVERLGISMEDVTAQLLSDGVRIFAEAFDRMLTAIARAKEETLR